METIQSLMPAGSLRRLSSALADMGIDTNSDAVRLLLSSILGLVLLYALSAVFRGAKKPELPWVGRNTRAWFFPRTRTRLWTMLNYEEALKLAYDKYARHEQPCLLAALDGDVILLPPSAIPWLTEQPESILSVNGAHKHILQTKYSFPRPEIMDPTVHFDVIRTELTRQVFAVTPEVCDEMAAAVDEIWGTDTREWSFVRVFESMTKIIARTSNRVFVGLPLCRDEAYIDNAIGFAEDIAYSATVLRLFPGSIRSLVAPLITRPNREHTRAFTERVQPEIIRRQQLQQQSKDEADGEQTSSTEEGDEPNDFLQWLLQRSLTPSHKSPDETDPDIISARLLHLNFASVHTTSFIGTNALLDILAAPLSEGVYDKLRTEALESMDADTDSDSKVRTWARSSLGKMQYLDSALRESSRRASIIGVGINHKVVAPGGVTTPDGTHLPEGSMVAVHSWGLHHDENVYDKPAGYQPFRFVDQQQRDLGEGGAVTGTGNEQKQKAYLDKAQLQFIATSPTYLGFGHGQHACPGRFFAANELKLLLAYLLTHYDMQMVMEGGVGGVWNGKGVRPECSWVGPNHLPPRAKLRIRRK